MAISKCKQDGISNCSVMRTSSPERTPMFRKLTTKKHGLKPLTLQTARRALRGSAPGLCRCGRRREATRGGSRAGMPCGGHEASLGSEAQRRSARREEDHRAVVRLRAPTFPSSCASPGAASADLTSLWLWRLEAVNKPKPSYPGRASSFCDLRAADIFMSFG